MRVKINNKWLGYQLSGDILQLDGEGEYEGDQESQGGEDGVVSQVLHEVLVTKIVVTEATLHPWDFFAFLVMVIQFQKSDN